MQKTSYLIAIGSNRRHVRHGAPAKVVAAAIDALAAQGLDILACAPILATAAVGPAGRGFANSAFMAETDLEPPALLDLLKTTERAFGRRRGRRWGPRVLDLDIILWSEGSWVEDGLCVPHPGFRTRNFVLDPLHSIAPDWPDPLSGRTVRQLRARLRSPRPLPMPVDRRRRPT